MVLAHVVLVEAAGSRSARGAGKEGRLSLLEDVEEDREDSTDGESKEDETTFASIEAVTLNENDGL